MDPYKATHSLSLSNLSLNLGHKLLITDQPSLPAPRGVQTEAEATERWEGGSGAAPHPGGSARQPRERRQEPQTDDKHTRRRRPQRRTERRER